MSRIHTDARASEVVLRNPEVEVPDQVDCFSFLQCASAVFLIQELRYEIIANHGQEVGIADSCVLSLGNVDVFLLLADFF